MPGGNWPEVKACVRCGGSTIQSQEYQIVTNGTPGGYLCVYCRPAFLANVELAVGLRRPVIAPAAGYGRGGQPS